jgi:PAS domain S-box-containing protein
VDAFPNLADQSVSRKLLFGRIEVSQFVRYIRNVFSVVLVFCGYYLGSKIGFALTFSPYPVSTLWPPNAILLAALLLAPTRNWWFLILAAFPAHVAVQMQSNVPLAMQLCWFITNSCEALIGAGLYRYFQKEDVQFDSTYDVTVFLLCVAFTAPFLSSFMDAGFVMLNGLGQEGFWYVWGMRFCSNVLAEFTFVPVIVAWSRTDIATIRKIPFKRYLESILLAVGLCIVCYIIFNRNTPGSNASPTFLYIPLPFLLWAATRFGFKGLSASVLFVALIAIWGAVHHRGPFTSEDAVQNAFAIQIFLLVFSLPLTYLTAVLQERKKAREIAVQNEERLRLALNAAQMSSWDWDLATNEITWSAESNNMFGTEIHGGRLNLQSFLGFLHPEDRALVSNAFKRAINEKSSYDIEYRIVTPDGKIQWVTGKGEVLFDENGNAIRMHGVNVDITKRKEAEFKEREQRRELYLLSRASVLGEFTGALAHELNQPLAAIMSNTQAAQLFLAQDAKEDVREALNDIIEQDNRAFDVIGRLRELLKKGEVTRSPVDINEILGKVLTISSSELLSRNIKVTTELARDLPKVEGDSVQLEQVILNLILNAAEAMSSPEITDRKLIVITSANCELLQITIEDSGIGIKPEKIERIFKPFYTTKDKGLGLGLAISQSIATAHGGKLWATNNPGAGAKFHLSLPCI